MILGVFDGWMILFRWLYFITKKKVVVTTVSLNSSSRKVDFKTVKPDLWKLQKHRVGNNQSCPSNYTQSWEKEENQ